MKYLCIDYGTKRIGLAVSYGNLAEPLHILPHDEQVLANLLKLLEEEAINAIVVGLSAREMAEETKRFVEQLQSVTELPIEFFDESFSSKSVQKKMIESQAKMSKRQQPIDHFAAAHILQEFLDTREGNL